MKYAMRFLLVASCLLVSTFLFANDPNREFSIVNNPNGVWSYGFTPTLGGSFSLSDTARANYVWPSGYQQGQDSWTSSGQLDCDNGMGGTIGRAPASSAGSAVIPWDTLSQAPGCHGEYSVLRWTAPLSGTYQFNGSFEGMFLACGGSTTDVHLRWNSANPLFDAEIYGFVDNRQAFFDVQQQVAAGDTIDFAVGWGINGSYYCDTTALQLRIDLLPAINIKPSDPDNKIRTKTPGKIPVAILSSAAFNAPAMVVKSSLTFGRIGDEQSLVYKPDKFDSRLQDPVCGIRDVNGDGLKDLVCQFDGQLAGFLLTDTYGVLRGKTVTGTTVQGTDSVLVVK
jgi:hypothetical protein